MVFGLQRSGASLEKRVLNVTGWDWQLPIVFISTLKRLFPNATSSPPYLLRFKTCSCLTNKFRRTKLRGIKIKVFILGQNEGLGNLGDPD